MLKKSASYIFTPEQLEEKRTPYAGYLLAALFAAGFALGALPAFAGTAMVHGGIGYDGSSYEARAYASSESYSYSSSSHDIYDDAYESHVYDDPSYRHGASYGHGVDVSDYGAVQRYHAQADRYDEQADRYDSQSCWYEENVIGYGCGAQNAYYDVPHPGDPYYARRRTVDHGY